MTPPAAGSGPRSTHEGDWICANCGAVAESNDQPCRECAGERFARLEAESTPGIDSAATVKYQCKECGQTQPRNSTPCNQCGNLTFDSVEGTSESSVDTEESTGRRKITAGKIIGYIYGAFALFNGLGFFVLGMIGAGVLWTAGGLLAVPLTRRRIEDAVSTDLSRGAIIVLILALHGLAFVLAIAAAAN